MASLHMWKAIWSTLFNYIETLDIGSHCSTDFSVSTSYMAGLSPQDWLYRG
jgi:hypothetical protein